MSNPDNRIQWRIPLLYALFAGLWILFSDRILALFVRDAARMTQLQTLKGWVFVAVTSLLLSIVLRGELRLRSQAQRERFQLQIKEQLALSQVAQERERYQDLFDVNPMPMWVYDIETLAFLAVNEAAIEHYGYTREEFLGMTIKDIHTQPQVPALVDAVRDTPGVLRKPGIWRQLKKDGSLLDVEIAAHDLIFNERRARFVLANDVTERLRMETLLQEANENLQAIVRASPLAIVALDLEGNVHMWNPAAKRIFGWNEVEVLGHPVPFVPPDKQKEYRNLRELLAKGEVITSLETQRLRKDGTRFDVSISTASLRDARSEITGFMAAIADISDRKRAEAEIRSLAKFTSENPNPVVRLSHDGVVLVANLASQPILEVWGCNLGESVPLEWRKIFAEVLRSKLSNTIEVAHASRVYYCVLVPVSEGDYINLYGYDITGLKQAEESTQRQYQKLAALRTIDLAITASLDLRLVLDIFLDQVAAQTHIHAATVLLLDHQLKTLEYAASRGFHQPLGPYQLSWGEGYARRIVLERQLVAVPDLRQQVMEGRANEFKEMVMREGFVSYIGVPLVAKGQVRGVLELYHRLLLTPDQDWLDFVETLAGQAAIAIDNASLFDALQRSNVDLSLAYDATIEGWSRALDLRDKETEGHTLRVTDLTLRLARSMGVADAELVHFRRGSLLHDIGKLGVPDGILLKPGPLTDEEWEVMRKHPIYAYNMISPIIYLRPTLDILYSHHERWDGSGYTRGLKGEEIPLAARIFALVDVWDALISDRPYRPAWTKEAASQYLQENVGVLFDPAVYQAFKTLMGW